MAAVLKRRQHRMRCHYRASAWIMIALLAGLVISGCVSLRIEKINDGGEILPPPEGFAAGKTSLQEVLLYYGAPTDIIDMQGHLALHYQRTFYRGGASFGRCSLGGCLQGQPQNGRQGRPCTSRCNCIYFHNGWAFERYAL